MNLRLRSRPRAVAEAAKSPEPRPWVQNPEKAGLLGWLFRYYAFAALISLVLAAAVGIGVYRHFASDLPKVAHIGSYEGHAPGITRIYAGDGTLLAELAREHRAYVAYEDMPSQLIEAFLATEDRRFFEHEGLDYRGLARAAVTNFRSGTVVQGGSTITQQVAKGFLSHERTLTRKLREAILAVRMESRLSKEQILEIYLNKIFLGHNAYGVGAAASRYFGKSLEELTVAEMALIAGLARAPSRYSPFSSVERAKRRRAVVLQNMEEMGTIDAAQRDEAAAEPIRLVESPDVFRQRAPYYAEAARQAVIDDLGEEAVLQRGLQIETALELQPQAWAREEVDDTLRLLDRRQGWRGPVAHLPRPQSRKRLIENQGEFYGEQALTEPERWYLALVESTARWEAQVRVGSKQAVLPLANMQWAFRYDRNSGENKLQIDDTRQALADGDVVWIRLAPEDTERAEARGEPTPVVRLGQTPRNEAALYTLEHDTGYVITMQGGHDYDRSQFNRPLQSCRQPGSVFKAIYYAYALDTGKYTMASILEDKPYQPEPDEEWNPENIHGTIEGEVLLRNAFIHSLNLPSIRLFLRLGADEVIEFARKLGFTTEFIADKALSLGASCVRMDELARAFGIFVRGGTWFEPIYVRRVTDKRGRTLIDRRHPHDAALDVAGRLDRMADRGLDPPRQVLDQRTAFLITKMLQDVVTSGLGRRAQRIGVPAAGKTGTASKKKNTTDTWFVGFTSQYVTVGWVGDDTYQRSLGDKEASYTTAAPMWTEYMERVVDDVPHEDLPIHRPDGIVARTVDLKTGEAPIPGQRSVVLYFREGTAPHFRSPTN